MEPLSANLLDFVKEQEGYAQRPFWDYKQWTSGYGTKARPGEIIDRTEAERRLAQELSSARSAVAQKFPHLDQPKLDALASFSYNLGPGWTDGTGLSQAVASGDWNAAARKMLQYNKAGGKVLPGLVSRRNREAAMFLGGPSAPSAAAMPQVPAPAPIHQTGFGREPASPVPSPASPPPSQKAPPMADFQSPNAVARSRRLADALTSQGVSTAPVQHWTQALARVLQAGVGSAWGDQANRAEQAGMAAGNQALMQGLQTGDMTGAMANPYSAEDAKALAMKQYISEIQSKAKANAPLNPLDQERLKLIQAQTEAARAKAGNTTTPLDREQAKADVKRVSEYKDSSDQASDALGDLEMLKTARAGTSAEGPILGLLPNVSPSAQAVESAAERVRLGFVGKTKGAVSDAEMKIFGRATPNMSMSDEAAEPIITAMELAGKRTQERAVFFDQWVRSKGSLAGAQDAWNRFTREKPIISESGGKFVPHPENVDAWKDYFGNQPQVEGPDPAAALQQRQGQPFVDADGWEEIDGVKMRVKR